MLLRAFFANVLADLQFAQLSNEPGAEDEREKHCRQTRVDGANRDVAKDVEWAEVALKNVVEEVVEHLSAEPPRGVRLRRLVRRSSPCRCSSFFLPGNLFLASDRPAA